MNNALNLAQPAAWAGVWTALVTPLSAANANSPVSGGASLTLDLASLRKLMDAQIAAGVRGLVIAGSTGEGSLLSAAQYEELLRQAHKIADARIPLVAGLGIGGTAACLRNAELAKELGYQGVLASVPAYVKAPQRGLVEHFLAVGAVGLPVCLYEVASRAASSLEVETLAELGQSKKPGAAHLVAVKDASGNLQRALDEKRRCQDRFALLSGDDGTLSPFLAAGGTGVISVASHVLPRAMGRIVSAAAAGDMMSATREQNRINPLVDALFCESNPVPVKSLLAAQGSIASANFAPPLVPLRQDLLERLQTLAREIPDSPNGAAAGGGA